MKFIKLMLMFSMAISASFANAQDEPAQESVDAVVDGRRSSTEVMAKQLKTLKAELEKVQAEAVRHAQLLQQKERALAEREAQIASAKKQASLAQQQYERAREAAAESMLRADKAMAEAEQAKVSQELGIGQYKALLQLVEKKQGPEHAYSRQLRTELMNLERELATISQQYGPGHPKVRLVKEQARVLAAQLEKTKPKATVVSGKATQLQESSVANLNAIKEALAEVEGQDLRTNPEAAEKLRARIADQTVKAQLSALNETRLEAERMRSLYEKQFVSRGELAAKENAVAMQLQRTQEMLEMQKRLLNAQELAGNTVAVGRLFQPSTTEERLGRLEEKVDRIAGLLEKMLERKSK